MSHHQPYGLTTPCGNCPFRKDVKPYLTKASVRQIDAALREGEFPCHKTTEFDDNGERANGRKEMHCAGALILMEKTNRPSQMMRICERIGLYDREKLNMDAPVYGSFREMAAAQPD